MKKLLYIFLIFLAWLFLDGVTDKVAELPNKSKIIYFAFDRGCPTSNGCLVKLQERYNAATYTNDIWVAPTTKYILDGNLNYSVDITKHSLIRFKYQIFPRRYYMNYNPIGFMLYISDRDWNEYYGGVVLTGVTPEMLDLKISPFGRYRDFQVALPQWVNRVSQTSGVQVATNIVIEYPEELKDLSDSYVAPYLYLQTGNLGLVSSKSNNMAEAATKKDFFNLPFSVSVNGRVICKTVAELYDDHFLLDFNEAICPPASQ